jgi:pimeloyl-ACP methyl ester carboxylesterase
MTPIRARLEKQGFIDNYGFAVGRGFIEDLKSFEIYQGLEAFGGNPLIIHGDQDDVVPVEIGKRYQDIYGDRSRLEIIEGGNHTFDSIPTARKVIELSTGYFADEL